MVWPLWFLDRSGTDERHFLASHVKLHCAPAGNSMIAACPLPARLSLRFSVRHRSPSVVECGKEVVLGLDLCAG